MRTLVVDPVAASRDALRRALSAAGEQVRSVEGLPEAQRMLRDYAPDIVVIALDAPGGDTLEFLEEQSRREGRSVFALVEGADLETGVSAIERGAADFLWRPVSEARVAGLLSRLYERRVRDSAAENVRVALVRSEMAASLVGQSPRWQATLSAIEHAAAADTPILLAGEAGTEQEEIARAVHGLSSRGSGAFVRIADFDSSTPAPSSGGGTVFLPSVERRAIAHQQVFLSWIERPGPFRVVLAVNESPNEAAAGGKLLPELFEALRDSIVNLPPLRERGDDVDLLARRFLAERDPALTFDPEAVDALRAHDWPGNVRELKDVIRRASTLADGEVIGPTLVLSLLAGPRARRRSRKKKPPVVKIAVGASLADVERRLIQKTLEFARGSKPKTAELLKLSLKTIYNKIKEYGLEH
ncbi:MAG: helix-turn-helix domain-containing protein [Acidobacteriota bacterium]